MTGWSDVDDHSCPRLREAWKMVPDDPPLVVVGEVAVPVGLTQFERSAPK